MKGWLGGAVGTVRPVAAGAGMPGGLTEWWWGVEVGESRDSGVCI